MGMANRIWVVVGFEGVMPTNTAAYVVAGDEEEARRLFVGVLGRLDLPTAGPFKFDEVSLEEKRAIILSDGDY
jgi:hypothetical protein